jgi:TRAP-type C4-dicarboxylate transport system permease small subunit
VRRALAALNRAATLASGALLVAILAMILYEVAARYFFGHAATWAFDLTSYGLLFVVFLAAGRTLEQDGHVRIDFFVGYLNQRNKRRAAIGSHALSALFLAILLWATARETLQVVRSGAESPSMLALPLGYVYWIMPVGTALLLGTALVRLGEVLWTRPAPR